MRFSIWGETLDEDHELYHMARYWDEAVARSDAGYFSRNFKRAEYYVVTEVEVEPTVYEDWKEV
jgi:hypothetical protein